MNDVERFSEVVEGYLDLATQLVQTWSPYLTGVSAKVASNTYQPDDVVSDFPTVAKLVTDSLILIGFEAADALAILTSDFSEEAKAGGFGTTLSPAPTKRTLALKGDLKSVSGKVLPAVRVTVVPDAIAPNAAAEFALAVDGSGLKARTYDGYVVATDELGGIEEVFVSVTIG